MLAGIDLLTGTVHALVKDRHRYRKFIEFLKLLDAAYPAHTAIKLILANAVSADSLALVHSQITDDAADHASP